jgi:replicative DNA helicase
MAVDRYNTYSLEKRILIAFITDSNFCQAVLPFLNLEYFSNDYAQIILRWVQEYFDTYNAAPNAEIEDIFFRKEKLLKEADATIIRSILQHLSDIDLTQINTEHSIDIALEFFRKQELELTAQTILYHLDKGKLDDAENILKEYTEINTISSGGVDNFFTDKQLIQQAVEKLWNPQESPDIVFKHIGALGDYMGYWEKGWLISVLAPMKRGKTAYLTLVAIDAVMQNKNVLFVSTEMPDKDMATRYIKTITGMSPSDWEKGDMPIKLIPVFDCTYNQAGTCNKPQRPKNEALPTISQEDDPVNFYYEHKQHTPCSYCRKHQKRLYKLTTWFEEVQDVSTKDAMIKKVQAWQPKFDRYIKTRSYPAKTATLATIKAHIRNLSIKENFDVDILVLDYGDLLKPSKANLEKRHAIDDIWVGLKSLAHELNILVVTASQTNRSGMDVEVIESTSTSEDIGKIAIADGFYALDQTKQEKRLGVLRISPLESRHNANYAVCYILQDLARSQFCLDSEIGYYFPTPVSESRQNTYTKVTPKKKKKQVRVVSGV